MVDADNTEVKNDKALEVVDKVRRKLTGEQCSIDAQIRVGRR